MKFHPLHIGKEAQLFIQRSQQRRFRNRDRLAAEIQPVGIGEMGSQFHAVLFSQGTEYLYALAGAGMAAAGQVGDMNHFHKLPVNGMAGAALTDIAIDAHHDGFLWKTIVSPGLIAFNNSGSVMPRIFQPPGDASG